MLKIRQLILFFVKTRWRGKCPWEHDDRRGNSLDCCTMGERWIISRAFGGILSLLWQRIRLEQAGKHWCSTCLILLQVAPKNFLDALRRLNEPLSEAFLPFPVLWRKMTVAASDAVLLYNLVRESGTAQLSWEIPGEGGGSLTRATWF